MPRRGSRVRVSSSAPDNNRCAYICFVVYERLAQLDRASGYGPEGRGFESSIVRQDYRSCIYSLFLLQNLIAQHIYTTKFPRPNLLILQIRQIFFQKTKFFLFFTHFLHISQCYIKIFLLKTLAIQC